MRHSPIPYCSGRLDLAVGFAPGRAGRGRGSPCELQPSQLLLLQPPFRARFLGIQALVSLEKSRFFSWAQHLATPWVSTELSFETRCVPRLQTSQ